MNMLANYPLQTLLPVRKKREEDMAAAVLEAQQAYRAAVEAHHQKEQALASFRQQKPALRAQAYDKVIGSDCNQQTIDELHHRLQEIDEWDLQLVTEINEAEKVRDQKAEAVNTCRQQLKEAQISLQKLESHKELWVTEQHVLQEKREEQDQEDHNDSRGRKKSAFQGL